MRLIQENQDVQIFKTFMNENAAKDDVKKAEFLVFVLLYGGRRISDTLSDLQYINYRNLQLQQKCYYQKSLNHLNKRPSIIAGEYTCR